MPTTLRLTWHDATARWKKKYRGKVYYFKTGKSKSDLAGYRRAWAEWQDKLGELDRLAETASVRSARNQAVELNEMASYFELTGEAKLAADHRERAGDLERQIAEGTVPELDCPPIQTVSEDGKKIWSDRRETLRKMGGNRSEATLFAVIEAFKHAKKVQADAGTISTGRRDTIGYHLEIAKVIIGNCPMKAIGEGSLQSVYGNLVSRSDISAVYASEIFDTFRQFIRWAWENRKLADLPRNMRSKEWKFGGSKNKQAKNKPAKKRQVFERKEIDAVMASAKDRMKLWVLLALNCGLTQQDISDLEPSEIDWTDGRIIRKRSKEEDEENVPTVDYKLWDETFRLLKQEGGRKGDHVLTSKMGTPLRQRDENRTDTIGQMWRDFRKGIDSVAGKEFKSFRKTGNTTLKSSHEFRQYRDHYLGHAPASVTERNYDVNHPSFQPTFDAVVKWLGEQFGFATR